MINKKLFIPNDEYRNMEGVANSDLMMVQRNPSDYIWSKNAPRDASKSTVADFGTALHTALLEPDNFDSQVLESSVAGRTTKKFAQEVIENPGMIVLTADEIKQVKNMQTSGMAHPMFAQLMNAKGDRESSIFAEDKERGIVLKIRPDIDHYESRGALTDVKSTANLGDWRQAVEWKNPLFIHNYGHTAAFYMYAASLFYGEDVSIYHFAALQKSVEFGRYPVGVFTITRSECEDYGFWSQMLNNLDTYAECFHSNEWVYDERFPQFRTVESMELS